MKIALPLLAAILCLAIMTALTPVAYANSAEPPAITVIVTMPPDDLELFIRFEDGSTMGDVALLRENKGWEAYYRFYYWMEYTARTSDEGATLLVRSSQYNHEIGLTRDAFAQYNGYLTLDVASGSLVMGQSATRVPLLTTMRVVLTLLIEGLILLAFGYRRRASWIAFVAVNLITQGGLNLLFAGPFVGVYWIFAYVFVEVLIFIIEMIAFALLLREKKRGRGVLYALAANTASLIVGGMLIAYLPV